MTAYLRAVVGAGPSGFYTASGLLDAGFAVDMYEKLPTPFGLVRYGVAPDHPKIKNVTRVFDSIATAATGFRFFGGVTLGDAVTRRQLLDQYHAVVYATGSDGSRTTGVSGEARPGSVCATDLVCPARHDEPVRHV